jgi:succinate dehydrogenase/fumarate reductase-like Fe-S protein
MQILLLPMDTCPLQRDILISCLHNIRLQKLQEIESSWHQEEQHQYPKPLNKQQLRESLRDLSKEPAISR